MSTGIVIMSTASLTETMKSKGQHIVEKIELQIVFDDVAFNSSDMNLDELFTKIAATGKIPQTSQPTPYAIKSAIDSGFTKFDNLVIVTPHSEISGTYQNCLNVAGEHDKQANIAVYQVNGGIAITEGMLIDEAIRLVEMDLPFEEITEKLTDFNNRMLIYTFPGDFEYLKVSGRVNGAAALLLNALNVRVVIKMEGGKPIIDHKGRGDKTILKYIKSEFSSDKIEKVYYTAIQDDEKLRTAVIELLEKNGLEVEVTAEANSVPAAHLGPNNFGLGVLFKK